MSVTHGGRARNFAWTVEGGNLLIESESEMRHEYSLHDILTIIRSLRARFGENWIPLANNVEKMYAGTEIPGLGMTLYDQNLGNTTYAQGASYLGVVLEESDILKWNGEKKGIRWRLSNEVDDNDSLRDLLSKKVAVMGNVSSLIEIGFESVGSWYLLDGALRHDVEHLADASPALYAFVINKEIKYVGKTTKTLKQRLYGYQKPGPTQATNIKVESKIRACLESSISVHIMAYHDTNPAKIGQFQLNLPAGLEDDIIHQLSPEWNGADQNRKRKPKPINSDPIWAAKVKSKLKIEPNTMSKTTFIVTVGKTYYRQGFFNVPVDFSQYFGGHGQLIDLEVGAHFVIHAKINRTVNVNDTPRIMGGAALRDWFHSKLRQGEIVEVNVKSPNSITISKG